MPDASEPFKYKLQRQTSPLERVKFTAKYEPNDPDSIFRGEPVALVHVVKSGLVDVASGFGAHPPIKTEAIKVIRRDFMSPLLKIRGWRHKP